MSKKVSNKEYLDLWREFCENMDNATPIDLNESHGEKLKRIAFLEKNPEKWFKYYVPNYYTSEPAEFHLKATKRVLSNPEWYEVRSWARELSKSGRTMMEVLYLAMTGKKKNIILVSNSADNAERLLLPYKGILERNNRIIADYGTQKKIGSWEAGEFKTRKGVSFRAIGAGQSPRGTRNEAIRPDIILIDDIDTDEFCRNAELVKERVKWIEQALIPTRSISNGLLLIACGNIIAAFCCITEMGAKADKWDIINIDDKDGNSVWPQKNTIEAIERIRKTISFESFEKEYRNNPMDSGNTFKDILFDKCPQLRHCDNVVIYADPAPSNSDKTNASSKAIAIIANKGLDYYVYKAWVDQMGNAKFCEYLFEAHSICKRAGVDPVYIWIENNSLQNPHYEQVILPYIYRISEDTKIFLPIRPDDRKKPEKYTRIEGGLEPLNRLGHLIFNIMEQTNEHMKRMIGQFKGFNRKAKLMDGPDCVEGGVWIIKEIQITTATGAIQFSERKTSKHRL
ncbi:conserved hypothetical protein [Flavobacterium psychrophilum]|uniref:hypothetical protein n=1 Tax=Flavobacterium psychrophilum TaxID=96345 RepID=UPI000B7C1C4A|nr:hypothetical protein [Flavobacterium psychrophilum]SNB44099.1 conserved hypothetical protein [Flavobacterium psychrophilum]